jgi:CubicO group peptidase (beta-lactamase class C family)
MDETILRYGYLIAVPGEHFEYSNLAYGILGYATISRVAGQSYAEYMHEYVSNAAWRRRFDIGKATWF